MVERLADIIKDPVWMSKVKTWKSVVRETCPFKDGGRGLYCVWIGLNCSYNGCPRRIFEEGFIDPGRVEGYESEKIEKRIATMDKMLNSMNNIVKRANKTLLEIEEEKAKLTS